MRHLYWMLLGGNIIISTAGEENDSNSCVSLDGSWATGVGNRNKKLYLTVRIVQIFRQGKLNKI